VIASSLEMVRELLEMDIAMLTEVSAGREVVRHAAGSWSTRVDLRGASLPLEDTFCQRLLEGHIGEVVGDVAADERTRDLRMALALGVGAWMGTPIRLSDARLYVLCCLAREARPQLGERDVRVLEGFRRSMHDQLEQLPRHQG
jgi:GAF domain-containing protein